MSHCLPPTRPCATRSAWQEMEALRAEVMSFVVCLLRALAACHFCKAPVVFKGANRRLILHVLIPHSWRRGYCNYCNYFNCFNLMSSLLRALLLVLFVYSCYPLVLFFLLLFILPHAVRCFFVMTTDRTKRSNLFLFF